MIDNAPNEIRDATTSVLKLIEENFGKDNLYYEILSRKGRRPRVSHIRGIPYVRTLRARFYSKENYRAVIICDQYLKIENK